MEVFRSLDSTRAVVVVVLATACTLTAALLLSRKHSFTKQNAATPTPTKPKHQKQTPICPFSKDTNFVVETADHIPLSPLELSYDGPNAARWLASGISDQQDTPFKLRVGLKRLRDSTYFLIEDENFAKELALKEHNLNCRRDICFVMEESSLLAQREVLDLFLSYLPRRYPNIYTYNAALETIFVKFNDGAETKEFRVADWAHAPLELCERIVQEDLILMRPDGTNTPVHSYHMGAAGVVFSFRNLATKLGHPAEFIHAPVPHFREHIQKSLNLMFSKLAVQKPLWRSNWDITKTDKLDQLFDEIVMADKKRPVTIVHDDVVKQKFLKVEYQTIRRLPKSNYLLFTVKTMINRLDELERVPKAADCLALSIRAMSAAMRRYKGIEDEVVCQAVLHYLDVIATTKGH